MYILKREEGQNSWAIFIHSALLIVSHFLVEEVNGELIPSFLSAVVEKESEKERQKQQEKGRGEQVRKPCYYSIHRLMTNLFPTYTQYFPITLKGRVWHHLAFKCMNVLNSAFYCHTCFYSENPNVPLVLNSFLLWKIVGVKRRALIF